MWAADGRSFDVLAQTLMSDLCFLDGRDSEWDRVKETLGGFGKLGVSGPFSAMFGEDRRCVAEVASVFAEQFHRLGYLTPERLLDGTEWRQLTGTLRERFDGRDVRRSEVEAEFGPPSLVVDQRVLCYAAAEVPGWVFVDCWPENSNAYVPGVGHQWRRDEDPLVRAVRHPAADFESGLILTLYGRIQRWGPGWWIHHATEADGLSDEERAIAAQLRGVEANDPSQSLRRSAG
jgi:hypothetical protein